MKAKLAALLIVLSWESVAADFAASGVKISFDAAFELAWREAPSLQVARHRVDGADAQRQVGRATLLPQVSLFGQWSENELSYHGNAAFQDVSYPGERYGVQVRQALLNMSSLSEFRRLKVLYQRSEDELRVAEIELFSLLLENFLEILLVEATLNHLSTEYDALIQQQMQATALYEKKLLPVTQLLETQSRVESLAADLIDARGNLAIAKENLAQLVGDRGIEPLPATESIVLLSRFASIADLVEAALTNNPSVAVAESSVEAAQRALDREKGKWAPNVDVSYVYQQSDVGFDNLSSPKRDTSSVSLEVSYPLFEGGAGLARLRSAKVDLRVAEADLQAQKSAIEASARTAWVKFEATTERVVAAKNLIRTAETNTDAAKKALQSGTGRVSDVLLALAQNTRAERDLTAAKFQYVLSWVLLELAAGTEPEAIVPGLSFALHGS